MSLEVKPLMLSYCLLTLFLNYKKLVFPVILILKTKLHSVHLFLQIFLSYSNILIMQILQLMILSQISWLYCSIIFFMFQIWTLLSSLILFSFVSGLLMSLSNLFLISVTLFFNF